MGKRRGTVEGVVSGPDRLVWQGRRVFLTGHTGFKGGWVSLWLSTLGARVRGFALDPYTGPNLFCVSRVADWVEDVRGDVNDLQALTRSLQEFHPEIVIHMAAQPLVRASYADPLGTYRTNVMGTANLLEIARQTPSVRAVVCITSDKCYENREWDHAYRETDPMGGFDPYSSSKACAEIVAAAYRQSYFRQAERVCGVATARAGNVIGGGDWSEDRLLPDLIRGFKAGETVRIRMPDSVRPWQHVLEPLWGYIRLAEELYRGNTACATAYNFGPDAEDAWPVRRVATRMAEMWGDGARWAADSPPRVHEAALLRLDTRKAADELGWHPLLGLDTALQWAVWWYRAHAAGEDMHAFTLAQIAAYEDLLHAAR